MDTEGVGKSGETEIGERLRGVRRRMRRVQWWRGLMMVATVALAGLVLMMGVDLAFSALPGWGRWGMFVLWVGSVGWAAWRGFAPLRRKIGLVQVARWIEERHPEMEERLSTVLELSDGRGGVSPELLAALERAAEADALKVDGVGEVRAARTSRRWARPAAVLAVALMVALAVWPREAGRLLVRAVAPFSEVGNVGATRFEVMPGSVEILAGDRVEILVKCEGAKEVTMELVMEDGTKLSQVMERTEDGFLYVMDPARQGFGYRARAGRAESDGFAVRVWPVPRLGELRRVYEFPEYTGWTRAEMPLGRGVEALVGTRVTVAGTLNTAVVEARLEVDGKVAAEGVIEQAAGGGRVEFAWTLEEGGSGEARVFLKHRLGREVEALGFPVDVLEDLAPAVTLLSPQQRELRVRPDELLPMRYEVVEDVGLAGVWVEVDAGGNGAGLLEQALPVALPGTKPPRFLGEASLAVGAIRERFQNSRDFRLRVKARDGRPAELAGPGEGFSEWVRVRIDEGAESLARQELRQEHDGAKEEIEKALQEIREARDKMNAQTDEVRKEEMNEHATKQLAEAAEKLAKAEEALKEVAPKVEAGIHATKADEVEKALEAVAESREELEAAPLQDESVERAAKLDQAKALAEAAITALEKARDEIEQDRSKVEELARLQDLVQKQQELARQAESAATEPQADNSPPQEWQQQQEQVENELRQQLRERPDARAEALQAQAEAARELSEEARELAENQQDLQEQAAGQNQAAQDPAAEEALEEALHEALAEQQAQIAREAAQATTQAQQERSPLADTLPGAAQAAGEAAEEFQNDQGMEAADSAADAAEALSEAANQAEALSQPPVAKPVEPGAEPGAETIQSESSSVQEAARAEQLGDLAERQDRVAEAMKALAEGNASEALQALQELQADAAAELADSLQNLPEIDGNSTMNEATQAAQQGRQQAQNAAKQGESGNLSEAAAQHGQAGEHLASSAEALERAAQELSIAAQQAAGQAPDPNRVPIPPQDLAEAFNEAAQASTPGNSPSEAAQQAAKAAEALSRSARQARSSMQGRPTGQPGKPGQPAQPMPAQPGDAPQGGHQLAQPDQGVPPELAKLGISAADWEKIQSSLKSDVGSASAGSVPEEYRDLVKGYFESLSKSGNDQ